MYSLMSSWMSASSSPNRNSASALDELGLADAGRAGEDERARRAASGPSGRPGCAGSPARRALMASSWPMIRLWSSSSMRSSRARLLLGELEHRDAGPVAPAPRRSRPRRPRRTASMSPALPLASRARPCCSSSCFSLVAQSGRPSRSPARRSRTPSPRRTSAIFSSNSRRSGGAVIRRIRSRRAGLVDEVDRLVRQEPVGDVAVGQLRRGHERAGR